MTEGALSAAPVAPLSASGDPIGNRSWLDHGEEEIERDQKRKQFPQVVRPGAGRRHRAVRQLSYFLAVVEHGGFTRAADALHLAQPSLSQAIRPLEREPGAKLFQRAGRGVVLTSAGEALVAPARRVALELVAAREAVASVVGLVAGRVDLVVQPAAADAPGELTARFRRRHPPSPSASSSPADRPT
ncbi:LysR family transcriptional regulator [Streptacidiphilus neutrinimicus]|uniref:LysR family transcriptional regulator n=1 Tax=Streptacidiphilus neutrinimicus TaxID=105420 RepID=UPI00191C1E8D|nr:LysR family transcriptional regulator [Streptacidiphilus neutrinimicus]